MKRVCILGATGSIGRSAIEVCLAAPHDYQVVAISAQRKVDLLAQAVDRLHPQYVAIADEAAAREFSAPPGCRVLTGEGAAAELAALSSVDIVVAGIVGFAGLDSTLAALRAGKQVALANKEAMVVAGELCLETARRHGGKIIPVDSEHSAIFQALGAHQVDEVERLLLTSSGGPFRTRAAAEMASATVEDALRHPTWSMGPKISIDSATLMNKALEVIEAHHLFGVAAQRIQVLVHPESLVHSMVEFVDGAILAQLGDHDMRGPIGYALAWPARKPLGVRRLDFAAIGRLTFEAVDAARFPCVELGHHALARGGTAPATLSAANEVVVEAFLQGRIAFATIARVLVEMMESCRPVPADSVQAVLDADREARAEAQRRIAS